MYGVRILKNCRVQYSQNTYVSIELHYDNFKLIIASEAIKISLLWRVLHFVDEMLLAVGSIPVF